MPANVLCLQSLVRRLDALSSMHTQECNRLKVSEECLLESVKGSINFIEVQIKGIKSKIKNHIDRDLELNAKNKLLEIIPGVEKTTIAQDLTFMGDSNKFKPAWQVAAFLGLTPYIEYSALQCVVDRIYPKLATPR